MGRCMGRARARARAKAKARASVRVRVRIRVKKRSGLHARASTRTEVSNNRRLLACSFCKSSPKERSGLVLRILRMSR